MDDTKKKKSKINMTTKSSSWKQIIVSINFTNSDRFIALSSKHVTNINRALKDIKLEVVANFICKDHKGLVITTNKVAANSDFNTIKNYIKNIDVMDSNDIMSLWLPQSKSYLKILDILYYIKNINLPILADIIERVF